MNKERQCLEDSLKDYRTEIAKLTSPEVREEALEDMSHAMSQVTNYISDTEDQRKTQIKMMG